MSKSLLIYESDSANAGNLSALFEQFGFSVFVADSEEKVQEILDKTKINAFIVRAENTGLTGFMLCKKIRALSLYASRPILLVSSDADEATFDRHREFDYHADYYLKIPTDDETILASMNAIYPFLDALAAEESAAELNALKGKLAEDAEKIDSMNKQVSESEEKIRAQAEKIATLEKNLSDASKIEDETGELKDAIVQKGLRIKSLEEKIAELEEKVVAAGNTAKERDEIKKQLDAVSADKEKLAADMKKVEEEKAGIASKLEEAEKKNGTLENSVKELEATLKNSHSERYR